MNTNKCSYYFHPIDYEYNLRQLYFSYGIKECLKDNNMSFESISITRFPMTYRIISKLVNSYKLNRVFGTFQNIIPYLKTHSTDPDGTTMTPSQLYDTYVGQYVIKFSNNRSYNVCIDMTDYNYIQNTRLLDWSDIYFKANYWESRLYSPKVFPIYYPNPHIIHNINTLRSLRSSKKLYDMCFIVRVWGGADEVSGIEHNLRLLEEISRVDCRKFIYAYLVSGDILRHTKRLKDRNIPCGVKPMRLSDLWRISSQSKISIIRLGMHYCIPWRMTDIMTMGACPVLDAKPFSVWPQELVENHNYLSLGIDVFNSSGSEEEYRLVNKNISDWLNNDCLTKQIGNNNSIYFDNFLSPKNVGNYILNTVYKENSNVNQS